MVVQLNVLVPVELKQRLEKYCRNNGLSLKQLVNAVLNLVPEDVAPQGEDLEVIGLLEVPDALLAMTGEQDGSR